MIAFGILILLERGAADSFAASQAVLLRSREQTLPDIAGVATFAGKVGAQLTPIQPAKRVVVAVLSETLIEGDADKLRSAVQAISQQVRSTHEFSIALLRADSVDISGPLKSRAQIQAALRTAVRQAAPESAAAGPLSAYTMLLRNLGQLGMDWSSLLVVGRLAPPDYPRVVYA